MGGAHFRRRDAEPGLQHSSGSETPPTGKAVQSRRSWRLIRRAVVKVARPYFMEPATRCQARALSAILMMLIWVENRLHIQFTTIAGQYMTALQQKDEQGFYDGLYAFAVFICVMLLVGVVHGVAHSLLQLQWSAALTRHYGKTYFGDAEERGAFYHLHLTGEVDNPDQRIVDEAKSFVDTVLGLISSVISNTLKIISFGALLYRISPNVFGGTIAYVFFGTGVIVQGFGSRLMKVQQLTAAQTATLRYSIVRVGENAESIAFFRGGGAEWMRFQGFHNTLLKTMYESLVLTQCLHTFTRAFGWATFAVGPLLVGPKYLSGQVEFGAITQASMAFSSVRDGLSFFMQKLPEFSRLAVNAERLNELEDALFHEIERTKVARSSAEAGATCIALIEKSGGEGPVLSLASITLRTPAGRRAKQQTLVEGLTFQVEDGMSVLIAGQSGIGKSSLLRGIAGLWRDGQGCVRRCGGSSVFFMPQRPYMFLGTLRDQLLYPDVELSAVPDKSVEAALSDVQLGYILERYSLDDTESWATVLSLGEQQRINFARVLLQPALQLVLIDEGTSACDPANERHLYELLTRRLRSFISVGHRPALRCYHTHALWLRRRGPGHDVGRTECPNMWSFLQMAEYEQLVESA